MLVAETEASKEQRQAWMEHGARYKGDCACMTLSRTDNLYDMLKRIAQLVHRAKHNTPVTDDPLDDRVDDLWVD